MRLTPWALKAKDFGKFIEFFSVCIAVYLTTSQRWGKAILDLFLNFHTVMESVPCEFTKVSDTSIMCQCSGLRLSCFFTCYVQVTMDRWLDGMVGQVLASPSKTTIKLHWFLSPVSKKKNTHTSVPMASVADKKYYHNLLHVHALVGLISLRESSSPSALKDPQVHYTDRHWM